MADSTVDAKAPPMVRIARDDDPSPGWVKVYLDQFEFIEVLYAGKTIRIDMGRLFRLLEALMEPLQ